jgi:hypothetical protein
VTDFNDVREVIAHTVLDIAEAEYELSPFEHQLLGERLTIDFELDEEPFEATRTELATIFLLRKAKRSSGRANSSSNTASQNPRRTLVRRDPKRTPSGKPLLRREFRSRDFSPASPLVCLEWDVPSLS